MSNVPESLFIDPEAIKQAYLKAFADIEFPENFQDFERTQIESREPGTAITARIWNDTINELRNICRALAVWMREYNEGVDAALDEFTKKINDLIQYLLEVDQAALVEWLMQAAFDVDFETPDDNSCYLVFTISNGEESIQTRSSNLKSNQIFWMVTDNPATSEPEPVDSHGDPIWRIKLDTSSDALADSIMTKAMLEDVLQDYVLKSELGEKDPLSPIESETVWGGVEEVYDLITDEYALKAVVGEKGINSEIQADNAWDAIEEVRNGLLSSEDTATLRDLAARADRLFNLENTVNDLETYITNIQTDIENHDSAITHITETSNEDFKNIRHAIIELQAAMLTGTASTSEGCGRIWVVNKSNPNWWTCDHVTTAANSFSFINGGYNNFLNTSKSSITATIRGGWCTLKMNLYFNKTTSAVNNSFVVPVLALPSFARPSVSGYDYPCVSQVTSSNEAYIRVISPDNRTYTTPAGSRQFTVPTVVLNRFINGSGSNIKIPANNTFIKAEVSYPVLNVCDNNGTATANFYTPHISLI